MRWINCGIHRFHWHVTHQRCYTLSVTSLSGPTVWCQSQPCLSVTVDDNDIQHSLSLESQRLLVSLHFLNWRNLSAAPPSACRLPSVGAMTASRELSVQPSRPLTSSSGPNWIHGRRRKDIKGSVWEIGGGRLRIWGLMKQKIDSERHGKLVTRGLRAGRITDLSYIGLMGEERRAKLGRRNLMTLASYQECDRGSYSFPFS